MHARWQRTAFVLMVAGILLGSAAPGWAAKASDGRLAARKAAQLAEQGKCKQAVVQFNKAYAILSDPAILFNRAECLRKMNLLKEALADYEAFLVDLPNAPNKVTVEERIVALRRELGAPAPAPKVVAPVAPANEPAKVVAAKPAVAPIPAAPPRKPVAAPAEKEVEAVAQARDRPAADTLDALDLSQPPEPAPDVALTAGVPPATDDDSGVSPWVWVGLGAVVLAGGAVAAFFLLGDKGTDAPDTSLGNYKF